MKQKLQPKKIRIIPLKHIQHSYEGEATTNEEQNELTHLYHPRRNTEHLTAVRKWNTFPSKDSQQETQGPPTRKINSFSQVFHRQSPTQLCSHKSGHPLDNDSHVPQNTQRVAYTISRHHVRRLLAKQIRYGTHSDNQHTQLKLSRDITVLQKK